MMCHRGHVGDLNEREHADLLAAATDSSDPLLGCAIEHCSRELQHRSASRIVDLRERAADWQGLRPGDRVPSDWNSRVLPNGLWRSAHAGRIIRVRY
jgi:hypothetical protein